jgi:hypothetical protein
LLKPKRNLFFFSEENIFYYIIKEYGFPPSYPILVPILPVFPLPFDRKNFFKKNFSLKKANGMHLLPISGLKEEYQQLNLPHS